MNIFEMMSFAELFSKAMGGRINMSDAEIEAGSQVLKNMAEQRCDWTEEQKELYKLMVDYAKENKKHRK